MDTNMNNLIVNDEKNKVRVVDGVSYERYGVQTHVLDKSDDICEVAQRYVGPNCEPNDVIVLSEKALGCTQGRAVKLTDIHPRPLARFLTKFVTKTRPASASACPRRWRWPFRRSEHPLSCLLRP